MSPLSKLWLDEMLKSYLNLSPWLQPQSGMELYFDSTPLEKDQSSPLNNHYRLNCKWIQIDTLKSEKASCLKSAQNGVDYVDFVNLIMVVSIVNWPEATPFCGPRKSMTREEWRKRKIKERRMTEAFLAWFCPITDRNLVFSTGRLQNYFHNNIATWNV